MSLLKRGLDVKTRKLHRYNEAGRRLKAALVSYSMGRAGVDYTLRQTPEDAGDGWAELAESLLRGMLEGLPVPKAGPRLIQ
jgi:hypothetical protein